MRIASEFITQNIVKNLIQRFPDESFHSRILLWEIFNSFFKFQCFLLQGKGDDVWILLSFPFLLLHAAKKLRTKFPTQTEWPFRWHLTHIPGFNFITNLLALSLNFFVGHSKCIWKKGQVCMAFVSIVRGLFFMALMRSTRLRYSEESVGPQWE